MTLPVSGKITLNDVAVELGSASGTRITLTQSSVRTLFGVPSGRIALAADGHGKSNRVALSYVFSTNTADSTITASSLPGYIAGKTDLTITVDSGVYVYSTSTLTAGLIITGATTGDTIALVNNGYIMGKGGDGAGKGGLAYGTYGEVGKPGGPAISINRDITLTNNSYIGGGGGGGAAVGRSRSGGAGGAGGGDAGDSYNAAYLGGRGGGPGSVGTDGNNAGATPPTCGGGGRIMPGVGGGQQSRGGYGGGAGGGAGPIGYYGGTTFAGYSSGGSGGDAAALAYRVNYEQSCGGGGGWGAKGGDAKSGETRSPMNGLQMSGGAGGKAIELNGYSVTYVTNGTIYGAVS